MTILVSGSQQGLDFVGRVLLDPGDAVFVELPNFIGATAAFLVMRLVAFIPDKALVYIGLGILPFAAELLPSSTIFRLSKL